MGDALWPKVISLMKGAGVVFAPSLNDTEVEAAQRLFCFQFPPDLRAILQTALPAGVGFPDWRSLDEAKIREWLDWPADGICFDIEHCAFWLNEWGPKPASLEDALTLARRWIARAPRLIPIFSHRYIPEQPNRAGNPVFSVHQTDIIYYGLDLPNYLANEFHFESPAPPPDIPRPIAFWQQMVG